ncbi:MAG: 2-dehydropantoate 2-reductase, partial [Rhodoferax sp.]|nr:2-dehydropantoate 2-reductase [Rhodoferax sp.]
MKIAVVGCGAMGSVYASVLAQAGNEVLVVDRWQAHVDAINRHGLRLEGPTGDRTVPMRAVLVAPQEPVELVILAVKAADVAHAATSALPLIGPDTAVLTIQNGIGSADTVSAVVGADRLMVGVASAFGASLQGPGHARHNAMQVVRFGAYATLEAERVAAVAQVWTAAGFDARAESDIAVIQWEKLICNAAYSAPCALTGMTVGAVMEDAYMGP